MPRPPLLGEVASSEAMMTERLYRAGAESKEKTTSKKLFSLFSKKGLQKGSGSGIISLAADVSCGNVFERCASLAQSVRAPDC